MELPIAWNGVALGFPSSSLRLQIGDPLRVITFNNGTRRVARYWMPGTRSTYFLVTEEHGYIVGFDVFTEDAPDSVRHDVSPDPSGVRLGDTLAAVKGKHPDFRTGTGSDGKPILFGKIADRAGAAYRFTSGRVAAMNWWSTEMKPGLPELTPLRDPAGTSFATALADVQQNESDGVSWEYRYLAFHPCNGDAQWLLRQQALTHNGGRAYDVLHVVCPATKAERDFYFDISSYFGKM